MMGVAAGVRVAVSGGIENPGTVLPPGVVRAVNSSATCVPPESSSRAHA
jgi:hypothetical protein